MARSSLSLLSVLTILVGCGRSPETVPFVCQAPTPADWRNPIFQDACEEACVVMIAAWIRGDAGVSPEVASTVIRQIASHEEEVWGFHADTNLEDTQGLLKWYLSSCRLPLPEMKFVSGDEVSVEQIKRDLDAGYAVMAPIDATNLGHPNYKRPPPVHMVLVVGYDEQGDKFVINDPGTSKGAKLGIFSCELLVSVIADYKSGNKVNKPGDSRPRRYLAIR